MNSNCRRVRNRRAARITLRNIHKQRLRSASSYIVLSAFLVLAIAAVAQPQTALGIEPTDLSPAFAHSPLVEPSLGGLSVIEQLPATQPLTTPNANGDQSQPMVVLTENPESQWLASCQSGYLHLMGDD